MSDRTLTVNGEKIWSHVNAFRLQLNQSRFSDYTMNGAFLYDKSTFTSFVCMSAISHKKYKVKLLRKWNIRNVLLLLEM